MWWVPWDWISQKSWASAEDGIWVKLYSLHHWSVSIINLFPSYYTWNVKNPLLWIVSGRKSSISQLVSSGEQKTECQQLNLSPKNGKHTCCCLTLPGRWSAWSHQLYEETTQLNQRCRNLFINAIYGGKKKNFPEDFWLHRQIWNLPSWIGFPFL